MKLIAGERMRGRCRRPVRVGAHVCYAAELAELRRCAPAVPVSYRRGDAADLAGLGAENDYDDAARRYGRERLDAGDALLVGEGGGRVVFTCWICFGQVELDCRRFLAGDPRLAFVYKVFVAPDARGKRIYPGAYAAMAALLAQRGTGRVMTAANAANAAANAAALRCGYRVAGRYRCLELCGLPVYVIGNRLLAEIGAR